MKLDKIWIKGARSINYLFYRQFIHMAILLAMCLLLWLFFVKFPLGTGKWLGLEVGTWFWLSILTAVVHQIIVWLVFRLQLGWAFLSKIFGSRDLIIWGIIFFPFLISRPFFVLGLAKTSDNTLIFNDLFSSVLALILIIPAVYTLWSVFKYFGLVRALGGDHFRVKYRKMGLVKRGAFKYTDNAMYKFAFFILWSIALFYNSLPALIVAIFQHLAIWVHYYCTEKPDMELVYGRK
ncbi:MAG: methyltransferase [Halanaerobiaceae bacterium]